jgi:SAM-dependent methyltransferase
MPNHEIFNEILNKAQKIENSKIPQVFFNGLSKKYYDTLEEHFDRCKIFSDKKSIKILSLGCGFAPDFIGLETYFKTRNISIEFVGIDNDQQHIDVAKDFLKKFSNVKLFCLDGSCPENLNKQGINYNSFDLVMFQHAYLMDKNLTLQKTFKKMMKETTPAFLAAEGHVYVSCYTADEFEKFVTFGNELPFFDINKKDYISSSLSPYQFKINNVSYPIAPFIFTSATPFQLTKTLERPAIADAISTPSFSSLCKNFGMYAAVVGGVAVVAGVALMLEKTKDTNSNNFNP